ncbi:MAG TPA: amino acid ABC transporter permease [Hyphomicrobiales bacterium]|nr:amino acid ABC transporter permease [Hyphomicrobiales bacterium]
MIKWSFIGSLDFSVIWEYRAALLRGAATTVEVTAVSVAVGSLLGLVLAILLQVRSTPLHWAISTYVEIWRNVPIIVLLFWVHFGLPPLLGISTSAPVSGIIAMSLQSSAYLTDIARTGIAAVPLGQWHAADAVGLSSWTKWRHVVLPQAIKIVLPALANVFISFIKVSAILSVLSVGELMSTAARISDYSFKPIEVISFVGLVYVVLGGALGAVTRRLERRTAAPGR